MLPIYLINLERSHERLQTFQERNAAIQQIVRFPAVDGNQLSLKTLEEQGLIKGSIPYTAGALGIAMTSMQLWDKCIAEENALTICEDDAIFHPNFHEKAQGVITSLPEDWDLILWGWNFDSICSFELLPGCSPCVGLFDQASLRKNIQTYQQQNINPQLFRLNRAFGIVCYSLSPQGARKLKHVTFPLSPLQVFFPVLNKYFPNNGIDIVMNAYYPNINAYVSFPPLVITENDHAISTIQTMQQPKP